MRRFLSPSSRKKNARERALQVRAEALLRRPRARSSQSLRRSRRLLARRRAGRRRRSARPCFPRRGRARSRRPSASGRARRRRGRARGSRSWRSARAPARARVPDVRRIEHEPERPLVVTQRTDAKSAAAASVASEPSAVRPELVPHVDDRVVERAAEVPEERVVGEDHRRDVEARDARRRCPRAAPRARAVRTRRTRRRSSRREHGEPRRDGAPEAAEHRAESRP